MIFRLVLLKPDPDNPIFGIETEGIRNGKTMKFTVWSGTDRKLAEAKVVKHNAIERVLGGQESG